MALPADELIDISHGSDPIAGGASPSRAMAGWRASSRNGLVWRAAGRSTASSATWQRVLGATTTDEAPNAGLLGATPPGRNATVAAERVAPDRRQRRGAAACCARPQRERSPKSKRWIASPPALAQPARSHGLSVSCLTSALGATRAWQKSRIAEAGAPVRRRRAQSRPHRTATRWRASSSVLVEAREAEAAARAAAEAAGAGGAVIRHRLASVATNRTRHHRRMNALRRRRQTVQRSLTGASRSCAPR